MNFLLNCIFKYSMKKNNCASTLKSTKLCQTQLAKQPAETKPADPPSSLLVACLYLHLRIFQYHLYPVEPAQPWNK